MPSVFNVCMDGCWLDATYEKGHPKVASDMVLQPEKEPPYRTLAEPKLQHNKFVVFSKLPSRWCHLGAGQPDIKAQLKDLWILPDLPTQSRTHHNRLSHHLTNENRVSSPLLGNGSCDCAVHQMPQAPPYWLSDALVPRWFLPKAPLSQNTLASRQI